MNNLISTEGLKPHVILHLLHRQAKPMGNAMAVAAHFDSSSLTVQDCLFELMSCNYGWVDYLGGRLIKIDFGKYRDAIDPTHYDIAHGEGMVASAVNLYRTDFDFIDELDFVRIPGNE